MKKYIIKIYICILVIATGFLPSIISVDEPKYISDNLDKTGKFQSEIVLPSYFSWRDRNGIDFVTPIRDQSPLSSCETCSLVAAVESKILIKLNVSFNCDLSEAHLWFNCEPNLKYGSYPDNNLCYLKTYGVPDEACWPYPTERKLYPPNMSCDCWQDRTVKITDWEFLPADQTTMKNALITYGPIPTFMIIYQDFMMYRGGIYRHNWGRALGPHMVTIVGYNDDPGYWIVKNSWGKEWGANGWFRIEYGQNSIEEYSLMIKDVTGLFPITFVDDDNVDGPWDGTEDNPFMTIQQGINESYEGYTVYVKKGMYKENIVVNKTLDILGEEKTSTIIDGNNEDKVVTILAENVTVSGFTIQHSGVKEFDAGVVIRAKNVMKNANAIVSNNIIQKNKIGVHSYISCSNTINNNIIEDNDIGIYFFMSTDNQIKENSISHNKRHGVYSEWGQGTYNGNVIDSNDNCGIYLKGGSVNNIIKAGNTIKQNEIGIKIFHSDENIIIDNNFIDNQKQATFIDSHFTRWRHNYWDDHVAFFPKLIQGTIGKEQYSWYNVDWHPSIQPH